mgnify:CR=1 FL=1
MDDPLDDGGDNCEDTCNNVSGDRCVGDNDSEANAIIIQRKKKTYSLKQMEYKSVNSKRNVVAKPFVIIFSKNVNQLQKERED